jgi:hypothetical protein
LNTWSNLRDLPKQVQASNDVKHAFLEIFLSREGVA